MSRRAADPAMPALAQSRRRYMLKQDRDLVADRGYDACANEIVEARGDGQASRPPVTAR